MERKEIDNKFWYRTTSYNFRLCSAPEELTGGAQINSSKIGTLSTFSLLLMLTIHLRENNFDAWIFRVCKVAVLLTITSLFNFGM